MSVMRSHSFPNHRQSRRTFISRLGAGLALGTVFGPALCRAEDNKEESDAETGIVGSNIYGWGQYAQRDHRPLNIPEVISALRDTGYDYLEYYLNIDQPEENARFADQLKAKGLRPVSLYTGARLHEKGKCDEVVAHILAAGKVCARSGFEVICCNPDPIGREKTDEELRTQAGALTGLGRGLKDLGVRLAIHNHTPAMADQAREFHYNYDHTQRDEVGFCFDVHWVWRGGMMPLLAMREYGDRVLTWHLRQSRNNIWWQDLDTGDIDYSAIAKYAREHNLARRFTVELALEAGTKVTRSVVENHRLSREFVRKVFGA